MLAEELAVVDRVVLGVARGPAVRGAWTVRATGAVRWVTVAVGRWRVRVRLGARTGRQRIGIRGLGLRIGLGLRHSGRERRGRRRRVVLPVGAEEVREARRGAEQAGGRDAGSEQFPAGTPPAWTAWRIPEVARAAPPPTNAASATLLAEARAGIVRRGVVPEQRIQCHVAHSLSCESTDERHGRPLVIACRSGAP